MPRLVLLKDKDPLTIKKSDMDDDAVFICRCGLSAKWPYCDSSHAFARKEDDATTYRYRRDAPDGELHQKTSDIDPAEHDPRPAERN